MAIGHEDTDEPKTKNKTLNTVCKEQDNHTNTQLINYRRTLIDPDIQRQCELKKKKVHVKRRINRGRF